LSDLHFWGGLTAENLWVNIWFDGCIRVRRYLCAAIALSCCTAAMGDAHRVARFEMDN